jgi:DNA-binding CsgD family transcriptional regulator
MGEPNPQYDERRTAAHHAASARIAQLARRNGELWDRFLKAKARTRGLLARLRENAHRLERMHAIAGTDGRAAAPEVGVLARLTAREAEVARLLALGRSNGAIAAALGISAHTARHHTESVMAKLGVRSRAAVAARLHGLLPPHDRPPARNGG